MQGLQWRIAILISWLAVVFAAARFQPPLNTTTVLGWAIHGMALIAALAPLSQFVRRRYPLLWGGLLLSLYLTAVFFGLPDTLSDAYLHHALTGLLLNLISYLLAWRVGQSLDEFFEAIKLITVSEPGPAVPNAQEVEQRIANEIYISRRSQRPLSLVLFEVDSEALNQMPNRLIQDVQHLIVRRYMQAMMARAIAGILRRTDLIIASMKRGQLVLLAPETDKAGAEVVGQRAVQYLDQQLGLKVDFSTASFPEEGVTYERLLESAGELLSRGDQNETATSVAVERPIISGS
jgi:GGDEF domain-containing protein